MDMFMNDADHNRIMRPFEGCGWTIEDLRAIGSTMSWRDMPYVMPILIEKLRRNMPGAIESVLLAAQTAFSRDMSEGARKVLAQVNLENLLPPGKIAEVDVRWTLDGALLAVQKYDATKVQAAPAPLPVLA